MASEQYEAVYAELRDHPPFPLNVPIEEKRTALETLAGRAAPPDGVSVEPAELGGRPAEWVRPQDPADDRAALYLHGGAYTRGSPRTHRRHVGYLAAATGVSFVTLDYRLAPEHPYPSAVEDALAGFRALVAGGFDPANVAIAGDSAGGGLSMALLLALRDAGDAMPCGAALLSPWADLTFSGDSWQSRASVDPILDEDDLRESKDFYLDGRDATDPLVSPVFGDCDDLPPLFVSAGDRETLRDDALALAQRAREGGVDVTSEIVSEMIHVFHAFLGLFPEADDANRRVAEFLRARLGL